MNIEAVIRKLLSYSFFAIKSDYDYDSLTIAERTLCTRKEFEALKEWINNPYPIRPNQFSFRVFALKNIGSKDVVSVWPSVEEAREAKSKNDNNRNLAIQEEWGVRIQDTNKIFLLLDPSPLPIGVDILEDKKKRKAEAMAKLTEEDKVLLGLK